MKTSSAKTALRIATHIQSDVWNHSVSRSGFGQVDRDEIKHDEIYLALQRVSANLSNSYAQVILDVQNEDRVSWAGTAHEIREIIANLLRELAPDDEVSVNKWYEQDVQTSGPTQKQRVRFILERRKGGGRQREVINQIQILDDRIAGLIRSTYSRASDAAHRFKDRTEVLRILNYFVAFSHDLLDL